MLFNLEADLTITADAIINNPKELFILFYILINSINIMEVRLMARTNLEMDTVVVQKEGIDVTDINGEKAMMDLEKGKYFVLNDVGSSIWDIIKAPCSIEEIVLHLMKEYDVEASTCEKSTLNFLERLNNAELITIK